MIGKDDVMFLLGRNRPVAPLLTHPLDTMSEWKSEYRQICKEYKRNFGQYPNLKNPSTLFVEKVLLDDQGKIPADWKFFVFSGQAKYVQVNINRFEKNQCNFYDRSLQKIDVRQHLDHFYPDVAFPSNIQEMFAIAEKLGAGLDFVRVDLYQINGKIFFGEMTNYPHAGRIPFKPHAFDKHLGDCWNMDLRLR